MSDEPLMEHTVTMALGAVVLGLAGLVVGVAHSLASNPRVAAALIGFPFVCYLTGRVTMPVWEAMVDE